MGHPAQGRSICVDNAQCFRIFEKLQNGGVLSNCALSVNVRLSKLTFEARL